MGNQITLILYAGTLSFEFSHQKNKIVVNCGSPFINNKKWHEAMRSTAAHSTLNLDEVNSSDIFFNKLNNTRKATYGQKNMKRVIISGSTLHILDTKIYLE